jgi:hypothetical protein
LPDRALVAEFTSLLVYGIVEKPDLAAIVRCGEKLSKDMLTANMWADFENIIKADPMASDKALEKVLELLEKVRPESDRIIDVLCPRLRDIGADGAIRDCMFDVDFQLSLLFRELKYVKDAQLAEARPQMATAMRHLCGTLMFDILEIYSLLDQHWKPAAIKDAHRRPRPDQICG